MNTTLKIVAGIALAVFAGGTAAKIAKNAKEEHITEVKKDFVENIKDSYVKAENEVDAMHEVIRREDKEISEAIRNSESIKELSDKIANKADDISKLEKNLEAEKSSGMTIKIGDLEVNTSDNEKINSLESDINARKRELVSLKNDLGNEKGNIREAIRSARTKKDKDIIDKGSKSEDYLNGIDLQIKAMAEKNQPETIGKYLKNHNYDKNIVGLILYTPLFIAAYGGYKYFITVNKILNQM